MNQPILLIFMLLNASFVGLALDPIISKETAIELVRDALVTQGEMDAQANVAIYPIANYDDPDFITLQAEVPHPLEGWVGMKYYSVNPWTGDVWADDCTKVSSPTIKRKQDRIWKSSKLPDKARPVLQRRAPGACIFEKPNSKLQNK